MPSCIAAPLGDAMDASYDEVAEELHTMHDMNSIDSMPENAVYAPKQLIEILDLFTHFSILTHQQIVRLVPPHECVVSSIDLIRQQLLCQLPVLAVRLQYEHMRKHSGAHIQYIYVPALNGSALGHFVDLLEAAWERPLDPKFSSVFAKCFVYCGCYIKCHTLPTCTCSCYSLLLLLLLLPLLSASAPACVTLILSAQARV